MKWLSSLKDSSRSGCREVSIEALPLYFNTSRALGKSDWTVDCRVCLVGKAEWFTQLYVCNCKISAPPWPSPHLLKGDGGDGRREWDYLSKCLSNYLSHWLRWIAIIAFDLSHWQYFKPFIYLDPILLSTLILPISISPQSPTEVLIFQGKRDKIFIPKEKWRGGSLNHFPQFIFRKSQLRKVLFEMIIQ